MHECSCVKFIFLPKMNLTHSYFPLFVVFALFALSQAFVTRIVFSAQIGQILLLPLSEILFLHCNQQYLIFFQLLFGIPEPPLFPLCF